MSNQSNRRDVLIGAGLAAMTGAVTRPAFAQQEQALALTVPVEDVGKFHGLGVDYMLEIINGTKENRFEGSRRIIDELLNRKVIEDGLDQHLREIVDIIEFGKIIDDIGEGLNVVWEKVKSIANDALTAIVSIVMNSWNKVLEIIDDIDFGAAVRIVIADFYGALSGAAMASAIAGFSLFTGLAVPVAVGILAFGALIGGIQYSTEAYDKL